MSMSTRRGRQVAVRPLAETRREEKRCDRGGSRSARSISVTFLSQSDVFFRVPEASLSLNGRGSTPTLSDVYISSFLYSGFHLSAL